MSESGDRVRLNPHAWQELVGVSQPREFRPGDIVQHEGTSAIGLLLIEAGYAALRSPKPATQQLLLIDVLGPGDLINADSMWSEDLATVRAEALSTVRGHLVERDALERLVHEQSGVAQELLAWLAGHLHAWRRWLTIAVYSHSETRLLQVLGRLAERYGYPEGQGVRLQLPLRRRDLAELAGVAPETVIRVLSQIRRQGLIRLEASGMFIPDPARLSCLSTHRAKD